MPVPAVLRFEGVHRRFGALAVLRGVSGEVEPGGLLLVTGANGSGKSTLLRCLAGLLAPDAGTIEMRSGPQTSRDDPAARRRAVGYLAPDLAFYDELTVRENLAFFARLRRVAAGPALAFAEELGLPLDRAAGVLSSGMRQRLRWVWLELAAPACLLLDEPFQNLDRDGESRLAARLRARLAAGACAVVATPARLAAELLPGVSRELALAR
jgi:ABC-type multidrug transport system ATPase subunit